jgi:hypothetical protein
MLNFVVKPYSKIMNWGFELKTSILKYSKSKNGAVVIVTKISVILTI